MQVHLLGGLRVGLTHDIDMMPELVLERRTPEGEMLRTSPAYHEDLHEGEGPEEVSATVLTTVLASCVSEWRCVAVAPGGVRVGRPAPRAALPVSRTIIPTQGFAAQMISGMP